MNNIAFAILVTLHERGEVRSTREMARILNTDVKGVQRNVIPLAAHGLIKIIPGSCGRGRGTTYRDAGALKNIDTERQS